MAVSNGGAAFMPLTLIAVDHPAVPSSLRPYLACVIAVRSKSGRNMLTATRPTTRPIAIRMDRLDDARQRPDDGLVLSSRKSATFRSSRPTWPGLLARPDRLVDGTG